MFNKLMSLCNLRISTRLRVWKLVGIAIATGVIAISCATTILQPLRVSCTLWLGYEPLLLARDLGYYDNSPIQILETSKLPFNIKSC